MHPLSVSIAGSGLRPSEKARFQFRVKTGGNHQYSTSSIKLSHHSAKSSESTSFPSTSRCQANTAATAFSTACAAVVICPRQFHALLIFPTDLTALIPPFCLHLSNRNPPNPYALDISSTLKKMRGLIDLRVPLHTLRSALEKKETHRPPTMM